jgi:hypothetical protein
MYIFNFNFQKSINIIIKFILDNCRVIIFDITNFYQQEFFKMSFKINLIKFIIFQNNPISLISHQLFNYLHSRINLFIYSSIFFLIAMIIMMKMMIVKNFEIMNIIGKLNFIKNTFLIEIFFIIKEKMNQIYYN